MRVVYLEVTRWNCGRLPAAVRRFRAVVSWSTHPHSVDSNWLVVVVVADLRFLWRNPVVVVVTEMAVWCYKIVAAARRASTFSFPDQTPELHPYRHHHHHRHLPLDRKQQPDDETPAATVSNQRRQRRFGCYCHSGWRRYSGCYSCCYCCYCHSDRCSDRLHHSHDY